MESKSWKYNQITWDTIVDKYVVKWRYSNYDWERDAFFGHMERIDDLRKVL